MFSNKLLDDLESIIWAINLQSQVFSWETKVNIELLVLLYNAQNIIFVYSFIPIKKKPIVRFYFYLFRLKQFINFLGWLSKLFTFITFNADKNFRTIPEMNRIWVFDSYIWVFNFIVINFIIVIYLKSKKYLLSCYCNNLIVLEFYMCFSKA